jgi:quinoprotein glucose dehydrogenase
LPQALAYAQQGTRGGEWRYHSGDLGSTKYAPLDQSIRRMFRGLRIAWRRPAVDASILQRNPNVKYSHDFHATPIMIDGVLYTSDGVGLIEAFDPGTGRRFGSSSLSPTSVWPPQSEQLRAASAIGRKGNDKRFSSSRRESGRARGKTVSPVRELGR